MPKAPNGRSRAACWSVLHQTWAQNFIFADATGIDANGWIDSPFDSKAMRKVNPDETCCFALENASTVGAVYVVQFRQLIKVA